MWGRRLYDLLYCSHSLGYSSRFPSWKSSSMRSPSTTSWHTWMFSSACSKFSLSLFALLTPYFGRRDIVLRTLNIFLLIRRGERGGSCTLLSSVERSLSVGVLIKGLWLINFTHYSIRHNNTF